MVVDSPPGMTMPSSIGQLGCPAHRPGSDPQAAQRDQVFADIAL